MLVFDSPTLTGVDNRLRRQQLVRVARWLMRLKKKCKINYFALRSYKKQEQEPAGEKEENRVVFEREREEKNLHRLYDNWLISTFTVHR